MRNLSCFLIILFLLIGVVTTVHTQSVSDKALISHKIYDNPETWKLSRGFANSYWGLDVFNYPRVGTQGYIMDPSYNLYSGTFFAIDPSWNRMIYTDNLKNWIRDFATFGTGDNNVKWPKSIDAHAKCDASGYNSEYDIYIADTYNDRIVRLKFNWQTEAVSWFAPITEIGLQRPIDVNINNGGTFGTNADDYLWVISIGSVIKRFTIDGVLQSTFGQYGCDGSAGVFCKPTAVVSGRSSLLSAPYDPYANNNYFYVADSGNSRIVWLSVDTTTEVISWLGEVPTTSTIIDLEVDNFGQLWALDKVNGSVTKYTYDLFPLCTFGSTGTGTNQFLEPTSISNTGGYLASGNMTVTESWDEESGLQYFSTGTDLVDFSISSNQDNSRHVLDYVVIDPSSIVVDVMTYAPSGLMSVVRTLFDGGQYSGQGTIVWDGKDDLGQQLPTGNYLYRITATSVYGSIETQQPTNVVVKELWVNHVPTCCVGIRGNVDGDPLESIDIADLVYLVAYMFQGGPPPSCFEEANVDGIDEIDIADLIYLKDFMFGTPLGAAPVVCN